LLHQTTRFHVSERSYADAPTVERHPFWQVVLPQRGRLEMEIANVRGCAGERWYALVPVGVDHRYWASGPNRFLILDLAPELVAETADALDRRTRASDPAFPLLDERAAALGTLLQAELNRGNLAEHLIAESLGLYAASLLLAPVRTLAAAEPASSAARRLALRARDLLDVAFDRPLTIAEIAREVGASPAHLQRAFRAHFGLTIVSWLQQRRLARARDLLLTTDLSITEVALASGFGDHSYFTRLFTREIGTAPSRFRASLRAQSDKDLRRFSKTPPG
jgi:AraC-like DNA-binding protein